MYAQKCRTVGLQKNANSLVKNRIKSKINNGGIQLSSPTFTRSGYVPLVLGFFNLGGLAADFDIRKKTKHLL